MSDKRADVYVVEYTDKFGDRRLSLVCETLAIAQGLASDLRRGGFRSDPVVHEVIEHTKATAMRKGVAVLALIEQAMTQSPDTAMAEVGRLLNTYAPGAPSRDAGMPAPTYCPRCSGRGLLDDDHCDGKYPCGTCNGQGKLPMQLACPECGGRGERRLSFYGDSDPDYERCARCDGKGTVAA